MTFEENPNRMALVVAGGLLLLLLDAFPTGSW